MSTSARRCRSASADAPGRAEGDIIIAADGQPIKTQRDLRGVLGNRKPGDTLILTVQRGNSQGEARVTLAESPRPS